MSTLIQGQIHRRWTALTPVFYAALFLAFAVLALEFAFSYTLNLFRPPIGSTGFDNAIELQNLVQSLVSFLLSPVIMFMVFYKIGSRLDVDVHMRYFDILWSAFAGGLIGLSLGYVIISALFAAYYGGYGILGQSPTLFSIADLAIGVVRSAISTSLIAFVGIILSHRPSVGPTEVDIAKSGDTPTQE